MMSERTNMFAGFNKNLTQKVFLAKSTFLPHAQYFLLIFLVMKERFNYFVAIKNCKAFEFLEIIVTTNALFHLNDIYLLQKIRRLLTTFLNNRKNI